MRPWTTVNYFTLDPWTAEGKQDRLYEYACHEHNYGMVNALRGARTDRQWALDEATVGGSVEDSRRRHWTSGVMLTPTSDGAAKARAYYMVIDVSKNQAVVTSTGSFDDLFVKTAAGWRFKRHKVRSDAGAD